jgi:hypothetical protein
VAAWRGGGLPQQPASTATAAVSNHAIIEVIQNSGAQFHMESVRAEWLGNPDAYRALEKFLTTNAGGSQDERKALDALATVAGASPALASQALVNLEKFALDDCGYASAPDVCGAAVSATVATEKAEVPAAMAILGYSAKRSNNEEIALEVSRFLKRAQDISFWRGSHWTSDGYLNDLTDEGKTRRNEWLVKLSADASDRLAAHAKLAISAVPIARR